MTARPDTGAKHIIITIDGAAGTGKSTAAHHLAQRLGLDFLDTGAMYRGVTLLAIDRNIDPNDGPAIAEALGSVDLHFDWTTDPPALMIDERDVSHDIRAMEVSRHVSIVAAHPEVRTALVTQQRSISQRHPRLVTEGRDQGSVVFPDAPLRFFLQADVAVRAERRLDQLRAAGSIPMMYLTDRKSWGLISARSTRRWRPGRAPVPRYAARKRGSSRSTPPRWRSRTAPRVT